MYKDGTFLPFTCLEIFFFNPKTLPFGEPFPIGGHCSYWDIESHIFLKENRNFTVIFVRLQSHQVLSAGCRPSERYQDPCSKLRRLPTWQYRSDVGFSSVTDIAPAISPRRVCRSDANIAPIKALKIGWISPIFIGKTSVTHCRIRRSDIMPAG